MVAWNLWTLLNEFERPFLGMNGVPGKIPLSSIVAVCDNKEIFNKIILIERAAHPNIIKQWHT
jgi:hypothetical protein